MTSKEFHQRRRSFIRALGKNSIALIVANSLQYRNRDVEYPFRPGSDFYYLSGFPEPDALLVIIPNRPEGEVLLFCQERKAEKELWTGPQIGIAGAQENYRIDAAYPLNQIESLLPALLENRSRLYYAFGLNPDFDRKVMNWINQVRCKARSGISAPREIIDIQYILHEQRLIKTPAEIRRIKKAARIAARAHSRVMTICHPEMYEYQLEAELIRDFARAGARIPAYPTIVAAGNNAGILHYTKNSAVIRSGDLVLIDAGCEFEYYASDITRTFPANGRFTQPQRELYELVLQAQLAALNQVRPGNHWNQPHDTAVQILTEGLVTLKILSGSVAELIKTEAYKQFFPHRTGHWLGLDVHDVGAYKINDEWRVLQPGMVLTVEPGIYFPVGAADVPERYQGIGIRIEDTCLVTENDPEVLTAIVPKYPEDIEELMQNGKVS